MDMQAEQSELGHELRKEPKYNKGWANLRPAKPGEVRNPRGRPKKDLDLAALAQKHAEKAIETLVDVMSNVDATPSARVSAAAEILDRGFGTAPQSIDLHHKHSFTTEFEAFIRELSTRRTEKVIEHVENNSSEPNDALEVHFSQPRPEQEEFC